MLSDSSVLIQLYFITVGEKNRKSKRHNIRIEWNKCNLGTCEGLSDFFRVNSEIDFFIYHFRKIYLLLLFLPVAQLFNSFCAAGISLRIAAAAPLNPKSALSSLHPPFHDDALLPHRTIRRPVQPWNVLLWPASILSLLPLVNYPFRGTCPQTYRPAWQAESGA